MAAPRPALLVQVRLVQVVVELALLPVDRLTRLVGRRLDMEREELPATSFYLKALFELNAIAELGRSLLSKAPLPMAPTVFPPTPPTKATALAFGGGCSYMSVDRSDVSRTPWTAEVWLTCDGPCGGYRVVSSSNSALLLRTTAASGCPGCVGVSVGRGSATLNNSKFEQGARQDRIPTRT